MSVENELEVEDVTELLGKELLDTLVEALIAAEVEALV